MIDSSNSSDKLKAVKTAEAPFSQTLQGDTVLDQQKMIRFWAVQAEAMQSVGVGFEAVVEATNALLEDNKRTRRYTQETRRILFYSIVAHIAVGSAMLFGMSEIVTSLADQIASKVQAK